MQWVKVEDDLPEPYDDVIVAVHSLGGKRTDLGYLQIDGTWAFTGAPIVLAAEVVAWMPLPSPEVSS